MTDLNIKDFLIHGAFLQIGPDLFKVLVGPFERHDSVQKALLKHSTLLYKPNFWDFLNSGGDLSQKAVYSAQNSALFDREEFISFLATQATMMPDVEWLQVNESDFKSQYDWSQKNFTEESLFKAVPIIRQNGVSNFKLENLVWCIRNLIQLDTFGWSYGFFENLKGFVGHTPEVLAQWSRIDHQLHTVALAGTAARVEGVNVDLLSDAKIRNEHQLVIDDVIDKLSRLSFVSKSIQGPTDVLELKYLLHLMTEFQLEVDDLDQVFEVIKILHPTSAMGIYPYDEKKLKEFSEFPLQAMRNTFAAPFAVVEKDRVSCVVAIRNMFFNKSQLEIYSGCGVTRESQYELEVIELENKRNSVKKMLGLNNDKY